ncbi:SRPBCC domain-containing protein [Kribbella solani]|uniref:Uncharacterized protein YndB with AHSA1/START domain n=1 Tax=Kribbella solani TaxID=236067 RepID=A0A841DH87_9ACTN|nr:SRPBCC domain-containing protein [Kribbella solani]MBB5977883.1 uncharacterized protein YndB with AHSA1/START domain [Kribbella solani]
MGFPDRIERVLDLTQPPAKVWAAVTTAEGLEAWFSTKATIDLRPGGSATLQWADAPAADLRIERVDEPSVFGFSWPIEGLAKDDPRRTYVEFTLEPNAGGTRLTVVESGFAQLPDELHQPAFAENSRGWVRELGKLAEYVDAR